MATATPKLAFDVTAIAPLHRLRYAKPLSSVAAPTPSVAAYGGLWLEEKTRTLTYTPTGQTISLKARHRTVSYRVLTALIKADGEIVSWNSLNRLSDADGNPLDICNAVRFAERLLSKIGFKDGIEISNDGYRLKSPDLCPTLPPTLSETMEAYYLAFLQLLHQRTGRFVPVEKALSVVLPPWQAAKSLSLTPQGLKALFNGMCKKLSVAQPELAARLAEAPQGFILRLA